MSPKSKMHSCQIVPPDIFSDLPANIIDAIVMRLPLRDAVRTSILSKRWRYTWCKLPELTLDQGLWETANDLISPTVRFTNIIHHLLTCHVGPISKFTLSLATLEDCPEIDNLISFLSRNGIQHLVLHMPKDKLLILPPSFFTCLQIRHLNFRNCLIKPPPAFKGFDHLVSLELREVAIPAKSLERLISHSPLLVQLVLQISISKFSTPIQIKAPGLRSFDFTGSVKLISLKDAPLLANLSIVGTEYSINDGKYGIAKLLESLPSLEHLHLGYYSVKFLAGEEVPLKLPSALNCLKRLHLFDISLDEQDIAACTFCLIRSSPYLQEIEIQMYEEWSYPAPDEEELSNPASNDDINGVPDRGTREVEGFSDVRLNHLRAVKLTGIAGIDPEMELIKLLLAKSPILERMIIKPWPGDLSLETKLEVLAGIAQFPRASPKAKVVYRP